MAWQEASVGAEANGLRLAEVRVNVGDRVKKGDVLATFAADTVRAEAAQARASLLLTVARAPRFAPVVLWHSLPVMAQLIVHDPA